MFPIAKESAMPAIRPAAMFPLLLGFIFSAELGVMFLLHYLLPSEAPQWVQALADAGTLTLICSGFLWMAYVRPLRDALEGEVGRAKVIMDTAAEGIISIDESGAIESFNLAAEHMFGFRAHEVIGRNVSMLMHAEHRERHDGYLQRYLTSGAPHVVGTAREVEGRHRNGELIQMEMAVSEIRQGDRHLFTAIIRDIRERKRMEERMRQLAHHDPLTGLANRAVFRERLADVVEAARTGATRASIIYLDLDGFKPVNDTLGHEAGDELLKMVARRLQGVVRGSDVVARLGGDEFALILTGGAARADAERIADKVQGALGTEFRLCGERVCIGASVGIAVCPDDAQDCEALVRHADEAMYRTKRARRGPVQLAVANG